MRSHVRIFLLSRIIWRKERWQSLLFKILKWQQKHIREYKQGFFFFFFLFLFFQKCCQKMVNRLKISRNIKTKCLFRSRAYFSALHISHKLPKYLYFFLLIFLLIWDLWFVFKILKFLKQFCLCFLFCACCNRYKFLSILYLWYLEKNLYYTIHQETLDSLEKRRWW